ncbi:MAG TPA: InlB B-repeat-containing protein, partial [Bacilli bacterium]|nr:InlB B-repeat-containing protein [Bacilli bacterium]
MKASLKLFKLIALLFFLLLPALVSCKAQETASYCLVFDTNGGNLISNSCVSKGSKVSSLPTPQRSNFIFDGWYYDNDQVVEVPFNFDWSSDTILRAKWRSQSPIGEDATEGIVYELSGNTYLVKSYSGSA